MSLAVMNVKLSDQCGIYLSYSDINVQKLMAFVYQAVCKASEMIHNVILSVTVFKLVILVTAKLFCSDFFPFKLLSPEKKVLYKPLCDPAVLHMTVCVTIVEIPVLFLWIVILLCICHFIGIFHKLRILCSETICKQSCNF